MLDLDTVSWLDSLALDAYRAWGLLDSQWECCTPAERRVQRAWLLHRLVLGMGPATDMLMPTALVHDRDLLARAYRDQAELTVSERDLCLTQLKQVGRCLEYLLLLVSGSNWDQGREPCERWVRNLIRRLDPKIPAQELESLTLPGGSLFGESRQVRTAEAVIYAAGFGVPLGRQAAGVLLRMYRDGLSLQAACRREDGMPYWRMKAAVDQLMGRLAEPCLVKVLECGFPFGQPECWFLSRGVSAGWWMERDRDPGWRLDFLQVPDTYRAAFQSVGAGTLQDICQVILPEEAPDVLDWMHRPGLSEMPSWTESRLLDLVGSEPILVLRAYLYAVGLAPHLSEAVGRYRTQGAPKAFAASCLRALGWPEPRVCGAVQNEAVAQEAMEFLAGLVPDAGYEVKPLDAAMYYAYHCRSLNHRGCASLFAQPVDQLRMDWGRMLKACGSHLHTRFPQY